MKCPKCGFNSFEYHDLCKKCLHDLSGYKQTFGIQGIVLPKEARETLASSRIGEAVETGQTPRTPETVADMFSFDLPEDGSAASAAQPAAAGNPFNFDTEPAAPEAPSAPAHDPFDFAQEPASAEPPSFYEFSSDNGQKSAQDKAEADAFASLLDSTGLGGGDAAPAAPAASVAGDDDEFELENFSWTETPPEAKQAAPASQAAGHAPGEFDLENFSWEETPATPGTAPTPGTDANPFGDLGGTAKK
jgi:predicted  nucleic acid-binding Zn-ribbon protein